MPGYPILCYFCSFVPSIKNVWVCPVNASSSFKAQLIHNLYRKPFLMLFSRNEHLPTAISHFYFWGASPFMSVTPTWSIWLQSPCTTWSLGLHKRNLWRICPTGNEWIYESLIMLLSYQHSQHLFYHCLGHIKEQVPLESKGLPQTHE